MFTPVPLRIIITVLLSLLFTFLLTRSDLQGSDGSQFSTHSEPGKDRYSSFFISKQDTLPNVQVEDTTFRLDEIFVRSTRIQEPLRYQPVDVQQVDSMQLLMYRTLPVSAVLSRYSSLFVRNNGPGGAATLSQRGLSPSQTQVLWEGFPINSLSLGLADLSVIPAGLFSSVEVSPGTPSSAFGGGSLGGTVYLSSMSSGGNHLEFRQAAGAFGTWNSQLRTGFEGDRLSASFRALYNTADNNFRYFNRATGQEEERLHNSGRSGHLMGNIGYLFPRARIYSAIWLFDSHEKIPGSILSGSSRAEQSNSGFRGIGGIEAPAGPWRINAGTYLEIDHFNYEDAATDIASRFTKTRWLTEIDFRRSSTAEIVWQGGFRGGLEMVNTNNYSDSHQRYLFGFRMNPEVRLFDDQLKLTPTARVDAYSEFGWVLSPSMGANLEVIEERFYLRGMASRDFNPPSFNDLYWVPGGNPGLEPELSLKAEAGLTYLPDIALFESFSLTGYRIWIDNGIYWFPGAGGAWAPSNVEEVDAYGMEARTETGWSLKGMNFRWSAGVDWRRSEITASRFPGDQATGRQMRYVPEWAIRSDLSFRAAPVILHMSYQWTDRRYVTEDHTSSLKEFQTADLSVAWEQEFLGTDWYLRFSVHNLFDEQYEIIQWYPMPGRHLTFSIGMGLPM